MAKAEGERALAEARASNEKVNFEIEKVKIETQARIEIATKTAKIGRASCRERVLRLV